MGKHPPLWRRRREQLDVLEPEPSSAHAAAPPLDGISVVIRCHQQGRFLAEAVSSVIKQTRPVDEIIVVDDGSTDETAEVLRDLHRTVPALRVIVHPDPVGPADAFNAGAALSSGAFILPLDADDRLSPKVVELSEDALRSSGADVALPGLLLFGTETGWSEAHPVDGEQMRVENQLHVSCLFRRWLFDATGGFDPGFDKIGLEDWDFWIGALEAGATVVPVDGCHLEYRRGSPGSRNANARWNVLRAHLRVYHRHDSVKLRHILRWMARSARRNVVPSR